MQINGRINGRINRLFGVLSFIYLPIKLFGKKKEVGGMMEFMKE